VRGETRLVRLLLGGTVRCAMVAAGCAEVWQYHRDPYLTSDARHPIPLSAAAGTEHRAVMRQHLETIQVIVNALVEEDYELAQGLTEMHLGFFKHRQAMAHQEPEKFPAAYHHLAMAHHQAAEELARIIPNQGLEADLTAVE